MMKESGREIQSPRLYLVVSAAHLVDPRYSGKLSTPIAPVGSDQDDLVVAARAYDRVQVVRTVSMPSVKRKLRRPAP